MELPPNNQPEATMPEHQAVAQQQPKPARDVGPGGKPWDEAFNEVKEGRDSWKQKARTMEQELEGYRSKEKERAAMEAQQQDQQERQRLEKEGKYQEALKSFETKAQEKERAIRQRIESRLVPLAIQSAAAKIANLTPEAIQDLPAMLGGSLALDPETLEVYARGQDGKPITDDRLNQISLDEHIRKFVEARPYLMLDGMPKRHGQGSGNAKRFTFDAAMKDSNLATEWKAADPVGYGEAEKAYWSPTAVKARLIANKKKF